MSPGGLSRLEDRLGHRFRNPALLQHALTHASSTTDRLQSNERLEFLGDRVLGPEEGGDGARERRQVRVRGARLGDVDLELELRARPPQERRAPGAMLRGGDLTFGPPQTEAQ